MNGIEQLLVYPVQHAQLQGGVVGPRMRHPGRIQYAGHQPELDIFRFCAQPFQQMRFVLVAMRAAVPEDFQDFDLLPRMGRQRGIERDIFALDGLGRVRGTGCQANKRE